MCRYRSLQPNNQNTKTQWMRRKANYICTGNTVGFLFVLIVKRIHDWWKPAAAVVAFQSLGGFIPRPKDFLVKHMFLVSI